MFGWIMDKLFFVWWVIDQLTCTLICYGLVKLCLGGLWISYSFLGGL